MTSQQKKIVFIFTSVIIIFITIAIFLKARRMPPVSLEMWGIIDEPEVFKSLIYSFSKTYPQVKINYSLKESSFEDYHSELLRAFANDQAPDIFMLLGNWLPLYRDKIQPLNLEKDKELNVKTVKEIYPQVVLDELLEEKEKKLLGIPLYVDTLALFYNKDIFDRYNIALPPATWEELMVLVPKLRKIDEYRRIVRSAIALGTGNNINQSADILSALLMQYGSSIVDLDKKKAIFNQPEKWQGETIIPGEKALNFYAQFSNERSPYYTWNENQLDSLIAFAQVKSAMAIGYHRDIKIFQKYNPQLNYGVASFPQFQNSLQPVYYASTMNLVVNDRSSKLKQQAAWLFLKFLAQKDIAEKYYSLTHNPPSRRDLIALHLNDPQEGAFIAQILTSRNWYQFDALQIEEILKKLIYDVAVSKVAVSKMEVIDTLNKSVGKINFLWENFLKGQ